MGSPSSAARECILSAGPAMSKKGTALFEWINKDASNITSKDHKKKANSHAQSVAWSLRKTSHNSAKSSPPIRHTGLPLHSRSSRHKYQQVGYDGELDGQTQGSGRVATGPRLGSPFLLSDPASDSVHLHSAQLDPFMCLAGNTSLREQNLLQYCNFDSLPQLLLSDS